MRGQTNSGNHDSISKIAAIRIATEPDAKYKLYSVHVAGFF